MPRKRISLEIAEAELSKQQVGAVSRCIDPALVRTIINEALSEKQREYLMEYYFDGYSMQQSAEMHGVALSTVSRTIHRAEKRIGKILKYSVRR